jgi:hypothetical protein
VLLDPISYNYSYCRFRLAGQIAKGSTPWMAFGLIALSSMVCLHWISSRLSAFTDVKKEDIMKNQKHISVTLFISWLNTLWAIETNVVAGALSA